MGRKIFVSYKYADTHVLSLPSIKGQTTVRDYVDSLQNLIEKTDNINKGENDGEDMSTLKDTTIASKLGDKIYDSSVTIIFISKGMKDPALPEDEQWIPWEISYSLREQSRNGRCSKTNAMLAIVLPDENGSYDYYMEENCCNNGCSCRIHKTHQLFAILQKNMFNCKHPQMTECPKNSSILYHGEPSYIKTVKWKDITKENFNGYIEAALNIQRDADKYNIVKKIYDYGPYKQPT